MASHPKREELLAQIFKLRQEHEQSLTDATFVGWTSEREAARKRCVDRIGHLLRELNALDEDK